MGRLHLRHLFDHMYWLGRNVKCTIFVLMGYSQKYPWKTDWTIKNEQGNQVLQVFTFNILIKPYQQIWFIAFFSHKFKQINWEMTELSRCKTGSRIWDLQPTREKTEESLWEPLASFTCVCIRKSTCFQDNHFFFQYVLRVESRAFTLSYIQRDFTKVAKFPGWSWHLWPSCLSLPGWTTILSWQ